MTLKDRVKKLRKENHYSQVELAKELGVSQSVISLIESGNASVSIDILKKLSGIFSKSCDWLIFGKDKYVKITLDNEFIPLVREDAKAGYLEKHSEPEYLEALDLYKLPGYGKGDYRIFEVEGDSMLPVLQPNDMIVCERVTDLERVIEGTLNVIVVDKDILVKRLYFSHEDKSKVVLKSDNPAYKEMIFDRDRIMEAWQVKSKLTDTFVTESLNQNGRIDKIEGEMQEIKGQLDTILEKLDSK